jgi:GAF domain-containing protein
VFAAITEEAAQLLSVGHAGLARYEPDGGIATVAISSQAGYRPRAAGQWTVEGKKVATLVFETGCPAQINGCADACSPLAVTAREQGVDPSVGTPVIVEERLRGVTGALDKARQARTQKHIVVRDDDLHPAPGGALTALSHLFHPRVRPSANMRVGRIRSGGHMAHRSGGEPPCAGA